MTQIFELNMTKTELRKKLCGLKSPSGTLLKVLFVVASVCFVAQLNLAAE